MHELPAVQQIIKIACEKATAEAASKVVNIKLVVGDRSGFIGESIMMYFEIAGQGTACEGADIEIEIVQSKLKCASCGALFVRKPFEFSCPECGGEGRPTDIGREFYIDSIALM
jgi:hydrogenase nickel incorporation protein HypA/HybF